MVAVLAGVGEAGKAGKGLKGAVGDLGEHGDLLAGGRSSRMSPRFSPGAWRRFTGRVKTGA